MGADIHDSGFARPFFEHPKKPVGCQTVWKLMLPARSHCPKKRPGSLSPFCQVVEDGLGAAVVDEHQALLPSLPLYSYHEGFGDSIHVIRVKRGNLGTSQPSAVGKRNDCQVPPALESPVNAGLHKSLNVMR